MKSSKNWRQFLSQSDVIFNGHNKQRRGWKKPYDAIFTHLIPEAITEIGIGNAASHKCWLATFSDIPIIGIERVPLFIGGCVDEFSDIVVRQLHEAQKGLGELHQQYKISDIKRLNLHYNRDGYSEQTVNEYLDAYGTQDIVINDGLQNGFSHIQFLEQWKRVLKNPRSLLIQERMLRNQDYSNTPEAVRPMKWYRNAINDGWLIYDCRDQVEFVHHEGAHFEEGLFGIWTQDKDYWKDKLSHIDLVDNETYYQKVIDRE